MSDPKNSPSFLRKVARFVANPTTDWAELSTPGESPESEYAKSEIKAMIERKRRNDFVRKREFDMLRKIRREGLTGQTDGAMAAATSNLDSDNNRAQDNAKPDAAVKAKIDAIEQQMVGESLRRHAATQERSPSFYNATTQPAAIGDAATEPLEFDAGAISSEVIQAARSAGVPSLQPVIAVGAMAAAPLAPLAPPGASDFSNPFAVDVSEVVHDPDLDEAVIAFANADFDQCERSLTDLIADSGPRANHIDTWLVLFDLYRATDQHAPFEARALQFAQRFGQSAPQWFSLPKQVAQAATQTTQAAAPPPPAPTSAPSSAADAAVGWACPPVLDSEAVAKLRSQTLQMPLPWVLDWSALGSIDTQACHELSLLLRGWAREKLEMHWLGTTHLQGMLRDAAPVGARDTDPAFWLLRLDVLRLLNRGDQFDEVAIDYCVTYEVSPPSWESATCTVHGRDDGAVTTMEPELSRISDISTSFVESRLGDEPAHLQVASLELSGQLVGDIGPVLQRLDASLGAANVVDITCSLLIRVDFIAAGDLLNWVLARRAENRSIQFEQANRLVALFFGAMGISEHARVRLRNV